MAKHQIDQDEMWKRLYESSKVEEVLDLIEWTDKRHQENGLSEADKFKLFHRGFLTLTDLTVEKPDKAEDIILEDLLPICLLNIPDAKIELHHLRECLVDWINQYPEDILYSIRENVLSKIKDHLQYDNPRPACWVITLIGYRQNEILKVLWNIVEEGENDAINNTALSTLASLGLSNNPRDNLLNEIHGRVKKGYSQTLASALKKLSDKTSAYILDQSWLNNPQIIDESLNRSLTLSVLKSILDRNFKNEKLQNDVWKAVTEFVDGNYKKYSSSIFLGGIVPKCNSVHVVPKMLNWLPVSLDTKGKKSNDNYIINLRLEESVRPNHLQGWNQSIDPSVIDILKKDACINTGSNGFYTTQKDRTKLMAWKTLLRIGYVESLEWFEDALLHEEGRFQQAQIMKLLSSFSFEPLPGTVSEWITEDYNFSSDDKDSRELSRRTAAIQVAQSASSVEAFHALIDFGLHRGDQAFTQSVKALAEVSLHLIRNGEQDVVDKIVKSVKHEPDTHKRVAASFTVEHIAKNFPGLISNYIEDLLPAIYDEERQPHERSSLIMTLAYIDWDIPDQLQKSLSDWATHPDRWLGGSSLEVLGHRNLLHNNENLLNSVLKLENNGHSWNLKENESRYEWAPYIVGLLYSKRPEKFEPAVVSLINNLDSHSIPQIYDWLMYVFNKREPANEPKQIIDALVQRVHQKQSTSRSETKIFHVLCKVAPEALVNENWSDSWEKWLPDARAALADAIGKANLDRGSTQSGASLLGALTKDGQYRVRRSAYRALAEISMETLLNICLTWAESDTIKLRKRAAEGHGWLDCEIDEDAPDAYEDLSYKLRFDPEKIVRDTANRTMRERRKRDWADQYISMILRQDFNSNEDLLSIWRYSDALTRVGDDSSIKNLEGVLSQQDIKPNVRYWIKETRDKLEENWQKTIEEWPEPWFSWDGIISEGKGKLIISSDEMLEVNYSIWAKPQAAPAKIPKSTWGGAVWSVPTQLSVDLDKGTIELENGNRGKFLTQRIAKGKLIFLGSGSYPR